MLEGLGLVEILHTVKHPGHHATTLLLIVVPLSNGVPKLLQALLLVLCDHLFVSTAQVKCHLSSLEPLL